MRSWVKVLFTVLFISLFSFGCGGGGGGGGSDTPAPGPGESTYDLSGTITVSRGGSLASVTVTLSGTGSVTATTDASGDYSFSGLKNGAYTITPSLTGYTFTPTIQAVTINGADATASSFVASAHSSDPISDLLKSLVPIPGGTFMMGSTDNEYEWASAQKTTPVHQVTLQAFEMSACEVTQAQYEAIMGTNPSYFQGTSYPNSENNPVESVTWFEAREFCTLLSAQTGRTFKLPSEAQWEYACRAGTTTLYSFGDSDALLGDYAWTGEYYDYGKQIHPVGTKLPNNWGLYDMLGNVWEFCLDSWHNDYTGAPTDGSAWEEPETADSFHLLRGSSWYYGQTWYCRSAFRYYSDPYSGGSWYDIGFRVVAIP